MEHDLSPSTLADLRRPRLYPAVSVLTPTHRRERDNSQDRVRLRTCWQTPRSSSKPIRP